MEILLLIQFFIGIGKRLYKDPYYRALGILTLIIIAVGTLFMWLAQGWAFLNALMFAVSTMSMNSPWGTGLGPVKTSGLIFYFIYTFLAVGVFLIFVLETAKTMHGTYDETMKMIENFKAKRAAKKRAVQADPM